MYLKIECEKLEFENLVSHTRFSSAFLNSKIESIRLELLEMQIVWKVAQLIILFRIYSYFKKKIRLHSLKVTEKKNFGINDISFTFTFFFFLLILFYSTFKFNYILHIIKLFIFPLFFYLKNLNI